MTSVGPRKSWSAHPNNRTETTKARAFTISLSESTADLDIQHLQKTFSKTHSSIERLVASLTDDLLAEIFSFLLPEQLTQICRVNKRWNRVSSFDKVWKGFCSPYWDTSSEYKKAYLAWVRRQTATLKEIYRNNEKGLKKHLEGKAKVFSPRIFFWPSYKAFRQRYAFKILLLGNSGVGKTSLMLRLLKDKHAQGTTEISQSQPVMSTLEILNHVVEIQMTEIDVEDASMLEGNEENVLDFSAVLLCFDLSNPNSFQTVSKLMTLMTKYISRGDPCFTDADLLVVIFICGLKQDLQKHEKTLRTKEFAHLRGVNYLEFSSKTETADHCLLTITESVFRRNAWPNYVPSEPVLRSMANIPELDSSGMQNLGPKLSSSPSFSRKPSNRKSPNCNLQ